MKTRSEIESEIAREKAKIAVNDRHIEDGERRQFLRRQYGDRLYNRLIQLEAQLEEIERLGGTALLPAAAEGASAPTWQAKTAKSIIRGAA